LIEIYTDGSCKPTNPGPGGWAFILVEDGRRSAWANGFLGESTNNIAEITALKNALHMIKSSDRNWEEINILTDSQYVIGIFEKNWNAKANVELIKEVKKQLEYFPNLTFEWVKAHNGNKFNEAVDGLAKLAVDSNMESKNADASS
jgi:ribonuclease HI